MNKKLAILGAGGHGKVIADAALLCGDWSEIVFFDDAYPVKTQNGRWSIHGSGDDLYKTHKQYNGLIVALGNNRLRLEKTRELIVIGANLVSIIHPSAIISPFASIKAGCVVCAGAVINVDAEVGSACIINTGAVIEHDCVISNGVHISPNATLAGQVIVGECSWLGAMSVARELMNIGSDVVVGAGAVVVKSIKNGSTVVGNPAKVLVK